MSRILYSRPGYSDSCVLISFQYDSIAYQILYVFLYLNKNYLHQTKNSKLSIQCFNHQPRKHEMERNKKEKEERRLQ